MKLKNITAPFKDFFQRIRQGYAGEVNPERDWFLLLLLFVFLVLVSAAVNVFLFFGVYTGEAVSNQVSTDPPAREARQVEERLEGVEAIFGERQERYQEFLDQSYGFVDPARN